MRALRVAVVVAFALDLATTGYAFSLGAVEANPVMQGWPFAWIAAAKALVLAAVVWFSFRDEKWGRWVLMYGAGATGVVAAWNAAQIAMFKVMA